MRKNGYITLISVLILGAAGIAITVSLLLLGVGVSRTSFAHEQSAQARSLANACIEEGMEQIRESTSFTGSATLSFSMGSCIYTVTSQGGQNRTVTASSTVGTVVRKANVVINKITPTITIVSWQEVAE